MTFFKNLARRVSRLELATGQIAAMLCIAFTVGGYMVLAVGTSLWLALEDPSAAPAREARLKRANENIQEFIILGQKLTGPTRKLDCRPAPDTHGLRCIAAEVGVDVATLRPFDVPLRPDLPLVSITWRSRTRSELVLTYSAELTRAQRIAILQSIPKMVERPPK